MYAHWQDEAKDHAGDLERFAAWMVAHQYVTEYQATLLARGHADGFFLNDYKILDRLGKGRMAGVYRAQHPLGQIVAIKVLPPSKARDPLLLGRFQREARLTLKLKHPNIVRAFQVGQYGELYYLVMEHLEGITLEELLLDREKLPPAEAVRIIHQALSGLQHIHEQGLVHRDLKPANLMLVPPPGAGNTLGCTLKILDIGLGRALFDEGQNLDTMDPSLTGEGVLLGTPDYMSPEQARDPRVTDIRADIYSLGCVLYHLLTGQPPFPDANIISQMIRHASETPRPLKEFNPEILDGLQQILNWMIAKEPPARYPTPERAARAMEVFLAAGAGPLSSPELDPSMSTYLAWLESENRRDPMPSTDEYPTAVPTPLPGTAATRRKPVTAVMPTVAQKTKPVKLPTDSERARKAKKKPSEEPVVQEEAAAPLVELDLITPSAVATRRKEAPATSGLTRRDCLVFFLGVASGLLAYALGWGLATLLGRSRPKDGE